MVDLISIPTQLNRGIPRAAVKRPPFFFTTDLINPQTTLSLGVLQARIYCRFCGDKVKLQLKSLSLEGGVIIWLLNGFSKSPRNQGSDFYLPQSDRLIESDEFISELANCIDGLLPEGGNILQIGCTGGNRISLAIARKRKFKITLLDSSQEALAKAKYLFDSNKLSADFQHGDVFSLRFRNTIWHLMPTFWKITRNRNKSSCCNRWQVEAAVLS